MLSLQEIIVNSDKTMVFRQTKTVQLFLSVIEQYSLFVVVTVIKSNPQYSKIYIYLDI